MSTGYLLTYIAVMAGVTYLVRSVPLAAFRGKIKSRFVKSFLYYIPYAVLAAMTFPAIFFSAGDSSIGLISALPGIAVALILALCEKGLLTVALSSCATVLVARLALEYFMK